ncbi:SH3 domain-containing protein [Mangrovicoccus algicola]|uniref:SH3 domain-containing protein n=1 Tax=Mangrovicoccus algicola TaxID=2771008 RepID=A0A8J6YQ79_9RHOB|nr:SH3 domain-containing protein [Mangrovicoccus algicola]MBE3637533.1 SH3 domain-containing protein [Mangrovicoccus algicola]
MIRRLLLFFALLLPLPAPAQDGPEGAVIVRPVQIALRGGPGATYPTVATVYKGDRLAVLERRRGWLRVLVPRGGIQVEGWLNAAFAEEATRDRPREPGDWPGPGHGQGGWPPGGRDPPRPGRHYGGHGAIEALPGPVFCARRRDGPACEAQITVLADRAAGGARIACGAVLAWRDGRDGPVRRTRQEIWLDLPVATGRGGTRITLGFDLPPSAGLPRDAVLARLDCRWH